jgi:hypothetical protein
MVTLYTKPWAVVKRVVSQFEFSRRWGGLLRTVRDFSENINGALSILDAQVYAMAKVRIRRDEIAQYRAGSPIINFDLHCRA